MTATLERAATDRQITLADGRTLGYAEYGDPAGRPIIYCHGWPSSRLEAHNYHKPGQRLGARIIGVDRPGLGRSTIATGYTIARWPDDVRALADALDLDRFAVVGISSGAPYALACAWAIPERLNAAAVVSGVGPLDTPEQRRQLVKDELRFIALSQRASWLARLLFDIELRRVRRTPDKWYASLVKGLAAADRAVAAQPWFRESFLAALFEAARPGTAGLVASIALEGRPWGFALGDVAMPVSVWHGTDDTLVRAPMARAVAAALPQGRLTLHEGEGHLSVVIDRAEETIRALLA